MARVLKPRKVDAKTKEVIAFAVAAINDNIGAQVRWRHEHQVRPVQARTGTDD